MIGLMDRFQTKFSKVLESLPIWGTILLLLVGLTGPLAVFFPNELGSLKVISQTASRLSSIFLGIFIEAVPFLLLGTLASGLAEELIPQKRLASWFPKNQWASALMGSLIGLFFPVCECGVIPFTRRLLRKGIPLPAAIASMLAVPVINPIVIASTYAAFGFGIIFWGRIGFSLVVAVITGLIMAHYPGIQTHIVRISLNEHKINESQILETPNNISLRFNRVMKTTADEFFEMGRYLVIGALLAALLQTFIPQSSLTSVSRGPVVSVISLQGLAVLLSICSTVDAFIALAFTGTFTVGSILGFLVLGPMVDVKSILMYLRVFPPGFVGLLVCLIFLSVLVIGAGINILGLGIP